MDEPVVIIPAADLEEEIEAAEDEASDTEELVRTLTLNLERQAEILKEVRECQTKLEALSNQMTTLSTLRQVETENPMSQQIASDVTEIRTRLDLLNSLIVDLKRSNQPPQNSRPTASQEQTESDSQNPVNPTVAIDPVTEVPAPAKRRRVIKL